MKKRFCTFLNNSDKVFAFADSLHQILFQDQHYQSLAREDFVSKVDSEEKARPGSGFEEEEEKEEDEEDLESGKEGMRREKTQMIKVIMVPSLTRSDNTQILNDEGERNGNIVMKTCTKRSRG